MSDNMRRYTVRINGVLLEKLDYIAKADGRTKNKQVIQLIKKSISEYEEEFGTITPDLIREMRDNNKDN